MVDGIETMLISNVGAVTVAGGFIWYLTKKAVIDKQTYSEFTKMTQIHLQQANKVIKDNTSATIKNTSVLQELGDCIHNLNGKRKK